MAEFVWEGVEEFQRFLRETPGVTVKDVEAALFQEGEDIMAVSVQDTPRDTGYLRSTAHVKLPKTKGGQTEVTLAYGTDYAIYVHEILTAKHPVGHAKYLETPVKAAAKGFGDRMQKRVLNNMGRRR